MKIIIISQFDPIHGDEAQFIRYGYLTQELISNGHTVFYITPDFFHLNKSKRKITEIKMFEHDNLKYFVVPVPGYRLNVGLGRLINHFVFVLRIKNILNEIKELYKPDLIIQAFPSVFTSYRTSCFAKENNIPFVIDIQDLWPEAFKDYIPVARNLVIRLIKHFREKSLQISSAFVFVSESYKEYFQKEINNKPAKVFPIGVNYQKFFRQYDEKWSKYPKEENEKWLIYLGTSTHNPEIKHFIKALNEMKNVKLFLTGKGDYANQFKESINSQIFVTGNLSYYDLVNLLMRCDAGLAVVNENTCSTLPGKVFYYMSANIPIITNLKKIDLIPFVKTENSVFYYSSGNISEILYRLNEILFLKNKSNEIKYDASAIDVKVIYKKYAEWLEGF